MSALSPTCNTLESNSTSALDNIRGNWGIDTVVLAYDVVPESVDTEHQMWKRKTMVSFSADLPENGEFIAEVQIGEALARVRLNLYPGSVVWEFEAGQLAGFSRPKLLHPDALHRLVSLLIEQFTHAFMPRFINIDEETGEMVWPEDWAGSVRIRRLDVTRDFALPRYLEVSFKAALGTLTPRYSRGRGLRYDNRNGGWTYYNPSDTQGADRIYNKDAQMKIDGDTETIRCRLESELKRERLDKFDMRTLSSVSSEKVRSALVARWRALRLDEDLPNRSLVIERLAQLESQELVEAMAYLGLRTFGAEGLLPRRKVTAVRKTIKGVGLNPRKGLLDQPATKMRLSLENGVLAEVDD